MKLCHDYIGFIRTKCCVLKLLFALSREVGLSGLVVGYSAVPGIRSAAKSEICLNCVFLGGLTSTVTTPTLRLGSPTTLWRTSFSFYVVPLRACGILRPVAPQDRPTQWLNCSSGTDAS